jgi:hypothetical protein
MSRKNFTQFELRVPILTSDFIVGYKTDGTGEYRARVQDVVNTIQTGAAQQLSFNENTKDLSLSLGGNTVSLSGLVDGQFASLSSSFASSITSTTLNFVSSNFVSNTTLRNLSGNWQNTSTNVQTNSANWQNTFTVVRSNSGTWLNTLSLTGGQITGSLSISQKLSAKEIELTEPSLDTGNSITNSPSALYITMNGTEYGIPVYTVPLLPNTGEDIASNSPYSDLIINNGDNGGSGFETWIVEISSGSGFADAYIDSAVLEGFGNIDTDGAAFGIYASPVDSGAAIRATRPLTTPLTVGNALSAALAIAFRAGEKNISLLDKDNNTLYKFSIINNNYEIDNINLNWPYLGVTSVFNLSVNQIEKESARVTLIRGANIDVRDIVGQVAKISFYVRETPGDTMFDNLRFNSLKIYPYQNGNQQPIYNQTFANVSANNITLTDANIQEGTTLTTSISSLVLTINGQQFKLPLLPL